MARAGSRQEQRLTPVEAVGVKPDQRLCARVFFALWPDDRVRDALYFHAQQLHRGCGGRVMRRENLHLTLAFIGDVAAGRLDNLRSVAGAIAATQFELVLDHTGYWRHNHIVSVSPLLVPAALRALVTAIEGGLEQAGFGFDRRPYAPHVTLLRDARAPGTPGPLHLDWAVGDFALVQSVPGARGAEYGVLGRWPLHAVQR